jgi:hypothetical protein
MSRWTFASRLWFESLAESPWTVVLIGIIAMLVTTLLWIGFGFAPVIHEGFLP